MRNSYRIELALIEADPDQPRRHFDEDTLAELSASIQARGIKQALTVRCNPDSGKYRIIDGERRFRAAAKASLADVPCVVEEAESQGILIDQIISNWQRADLRPYETADALIRLKNDFGLTPVKIAEATGKSLGEVSKLLALVERVAPDIQERVRSIGTESLTKTHLYVLSQLEPDAQKRLASRIEREHLTVVETERLIRAGLDPTTTQKQRAPGRPRKHVRIATKYGIVQLTPAQPDFNDALLIAMLHEARRELTAE
ncbi:MAG: ParB/RepB/Spo0J family partition protein [Planctomycetes bacterium]|nr:ParB/RepB/Spo0J family partition protein [Planctomycetota bacterium]